MGQLKSPPILKLKKSTQEHYNRTAGNLFLIILKIIQFQINQEPFLISCKAPSFKSPIDKLPILIRLREITS